MNLLQAWWFWLPTIYLCVALLSRRIWIFPGLQSAHDIVMAGQMCQAQHFGTAAVLLLVALITGLVAYIFWKSGRRRRKKRRNLLGMLGYKARAARSRLLARLPKSRLPALRPA